MKVWIDLSNSPHPLLFAPVARKLEQFGHNVEVTARDNAQTVELARERWLGVEVLGGESPRGRLRKAAAIAGRVDALRRWARRHRPDVALSHNSYAQIVAARLARIPVVTAMDFEHQPANHLAFRLAHAILVPEALPLAAIRSKGARKSKVRYYAGFKEELYLGDFEPDPDVLGKLGVEPDGGAVVVVRTPPSRAVYHRFGNPLLDEVLMRLGEQREVIVVVLARSQEQVDAVRALGYPNVVVPAQAVDSRSLMQAADLFVGAGGTMTREAALMGVPTFSIYAGTPPAVDRALETSGRLARLTAVDQIGSVQARSAEPRPVKLLLERQELLLTAFVEVVSALE